MRTITIFGPALCVVAYRHDEEPIMIANDSQYGLCGYVFGTDMERARRVARQVRSDRVN